MDKIKKDQRPISSITWAEREEMIHLFLKGNHNKSEIWRMYNIAGEERGKILYWMRRLGYDTSIITQKRQTLTTFKASMPRNKKNKEKNNSELSREDLLRLNRELQKKMELLELEKEAYRLTIEIAEKELKLPIRKKSDSR